MKKHRQEVELQLENVAIDDILPLKVARRDDIANLKWFLGPRETSDLISMVSFTFTMRHHPIWLASAPVWQSLVGFRLPCTTPGNEAERKICGGWVKTTVQFCS